MIVENGEFAFNIHEKILRNTSAFFDKALSGTWKEATERTVEMPLDEAEIYKIYAQWLYTGMLPSSLGGSDNGHTTFLTLAKAWVFGDKVLDSNFQNTIIDAIKERRVWERLASAVYLSDLNDPVIPFIYNNTTKQSPLRRLLIDIWLQNWRSDWGCEFTEEQKEKIPKAFLLDITAMLLDRLEYGDYETPEPADYYCGMASESKHVEVKGQEDQPTGKAPR